MELKWSLKPCHTSTFCTTTSDQATHGMKQQWHTYRSEYQNTSTSFKNYSPDHQLSTINTTKYWQTPEICRYTNNDCGHIFDNTGCHISGPKYLISGLPLDLRRTKVSYILCANAWNLCAGRGLRSLKLQRKLDSDKY